MQAEDFRQDRAKFRRWQFAKPGSGAEPVEGESSRPASWSAGSHAEVKSLECCKDVQYVEIHELRFPDTQRAKGR
jgi:hypothetical protein